MGEALRSRYSKPARVFIQARAVLTALLGVTAIAAPSAAQQCPPAGIVRTIVYRQITDFPGPNNIHDVTFLRISADGSKIAFINDGHEVFTVDPDGQNLKRVVDSLT